MLPAVFTPQFLARLETLQLRSRRKFVGSRPGRHASPRRGAGLEFADYRPYAPGDDPRSIDWKLYCRTDRHYIKLFQEEEDLYTYLFLDLSASMAHPSGDAKYAAARDLTLALAYIVLAGDDAVKLHALSSTETEPATPFFRGRRRFIQLHDFLAGLQPHGQLHPPTALARHLHTLHRPGKAIWVSDFLFSMDVFHTSLNARFVDSEGGGSALIRFDARAKRAYVERLARHNRELRSSCHQAGVRYAQFVAGAAAGDVHDFVLRELPALGVLG